MSGFFTCGMHDSSYSFINMKSLCQILIQSSLVIGVMLFVSCGNKSTTKVSQKKVRSGLDKYNNGYDLEAGEHGMMQSKSTKRSHFDNLRTTASGNGTVRKTDYNKDSYRKKRWGGDSSYGKKSFNGAGDYKAAAYKASQNTSFDKDFSAGGSNYQGKSFTTSNTTQERRAGYIKTGSSGYVTSKEDVPDPVVISREEYNLLGVKDSNYLLGR